MHLEHLRVRIDRKLVIEMGKVEFGKLVIERGERKRRWGRKGEKGENAAWFNGGKMALILYIKEWVRSEVMANAPKEMNGGEKDNKFTK